MGACGLRRLSSECARPTAAARWRGGVQGEQRGGGQVKDAITNTLEVVDHAHGWRSKQPPQLRAVDPPVAQVRQRRAARHHRPGDGEAGGCRQAQGRLCQEGGQGGLEGGVGSGGVRALEGQRRSAAWRAAPQLVASVGAAKVSCKRMGYRGAATGQARRTAGASCGGVLKIGSGHGPG